MFGVAYNRYRIAEGNVTHLNIAFGKKIITIKKHTMLFQITIFTKPLLYSAYTTKTQCLVNKWCSYLECQWFI